jgi:hypothetical protein
MWAEWWMSLWGVVISMGTGTDQSLVLWLRVPSSSFSVPSQILTVLVSKVAVHPASQSWPTERSELVRKWGNR